MKCIEIYEVYTNIWSVQKYMKCIQIYEVYRNIWSVYKYMKKIQKLREIFCCPFYQLASPNNRDSCESR